MNDNFFHADGETQNLYYKEILDYLDQGNLKLNYIMENNEAWPAYNLEDKGPTTPNGKPDLFDKCQPALSLCSSCSTVADWKNAISNKRQNVDITSYSSHLLDDSRLKQTNYLNYKIDGDKSNDLYQYTREMQKHSPSAIGDVFTNPIPTPDLYVRKPQNWWVHDRGGLWHSWRYVSDARISELTFNDNLFAPFVAAGWALDEEDNVRSAQWLALLKAQLMLGAYFFHAYHDGITEYPGGPYPYPRGYVWQVTTPAYAQAIGWSSHLPNISARVRVRSVRIFSNAIMVCMKKICS